jgi:outer membrane protein insertion porin family
MKRNKSFFLIAIFLLTACSGKRLLPPGEKLYTGATVQLVPKQKGKSKNHLKRVAKSALRPQPNSSFLGSRPKVWMYLKGDTAKKGLKRILRKQGEAPVYISKVKPSETAKYIDAMLFNSGVFNSLTEYKIVEKKKSAKVIYTSAVHPPYTISSLSYDIKDDYMHDIIQSEKRKTLLKKGSIYSLDALKMERERIDNAFKDNGYFFFNAEYLIFNADSSAHDRTIALSLSVKNNIPQKSTTRFYISGLTIDPDFVLGKKPEDSLAIDSNSKDSIRFTTTETKVKPAAILNSILIRPGELYSRKKHSNTLNRLMNMGTYQFARIRFTEKDSGGNNLHMLLALTTLPKRSMRYELNLISKSNDFLGPQLSANYTNRNTLNGGELLNVSVGGSFETQLAGKYKNLFSYAFNSKIELIFPRFLIPFEIRNTSSYFVPKTRLLLGYNYLQRVGFFDLRSLQLVYGFKWKESITKEHELNPVNINVTTIGNQTAEFQNLLMSNPFIKRSYEEQFIAGASYNYLYNEQVRTNKKHQLFINPAAETSGNLFSLISRASGKKVNESNPARLGEVPYSQYVRASLDLRSYLNFIKSKLVQRLFLGTGKAYGNSATMPYIRQFFSGGPNSIRAFPINSVGPSTHSVEGGPAVLFLQQGGDVKIEANIEYRFDIFKVFKGATFIDVGNTWLFRNNPAIQGTPFELQSIAREIAVGAGLGSRIDLSFFVIRFDLGIPLRVPSRSKNERWIINNIDFTDPQWRSNNLILNVAIGYPF